MESLETLSAVLDTFGQSTLGRELALGRCDRAHVCETPFRASIDIHGEGGGRLWVGGSESLARRVAATFFGGDPDALEERDLLDAMAELANILGGNLHSVISSDSALGLPAAPAEPLPAGWHDHAHHYASAEHVLHVALLTGDLP